MASRQAQKEALKARRLAEEAQRATAEKRRRVRNIALTGVVIAAVLGGVAALASSGNRSTNTATTGADHAGMNHATSASKLVVGAPAPAFRVHDVTSNRDMTLAALRGRKTLLFFSEGASCQACLMQAADLQKDPQLRRAGIQLVSISTDPQDVLHEVAAEYRLTTPMLADADRSMSTAYGMLGRGGMGHPTQDGHAFALVDESGRLSWQRAYQEMYVKPAQLLADMRGPSA